jgi:hypothetical protein
MRRICETCAIVPVLPCRRRCRPRGYGWKTPASGRRRAEMWRAWGCALPDRRRLARARKSGQGRLNRQSVRFPGSERILVEGGCGGAVSRGVGDLTMAKRSLRILKRVSNVPSLGVCELCNAQFSADPRQLGQSGVQQQFNAHKCDARRNAAPVPRETAKAAGK